MNTPYPLASEVFRTVEDSTPRVVLDLACGKGVFAVQWSQHRPQDNVFALDRDISGLLPVSRKCVSVAAGDMLFLPYRDCSFDLLHCALGLYYVPFKNGLLEVQRVLKPGGKAFLTIPLMSWSRLTHDLRRSRGSLRQIGYICSHVMNGISLAVLGRQMRNPFVRRDPWGMYAFRHSVIQLIREVGFHIALAEVAAGAGRDVKTLRVWIESK